MDNINAFTNKTNTHFMSGGSENMDGYSGFPRSPKSGTEDMDLTGIFTMKSPLSVLAIDMDVNFSIQNGGYSL
jgi:hypothetical protein